MVRVSNNFVWIGSPFLIHIALDKRHLFRLSGPTYLGYHQLSSCSRRTLLANKTNWYLANMYNILPSDYRALAIVMWPFLRAVTGKPDD